MPRSKWNRQEWDSLPEEICVGALNLFGSVTNVMRRLGLQGHISYHYVARALRGEPVPAEVMIAMRDRYHTWLRQYIVGATTGRTHITFEILTQAEEEEIVHPHIKRSQVKRR